MKMNPTEIIDNNKEGLVESIDVKNTTLWEKLIQLGLFTSSVVEYIRVSRITIFLDFTQNVKTPFLNYDFEGGILNCFQIKLHISFSLKENHSSNRDQVRELLNTVRRGGTSSYQTFREALIDNKQEHVVDRFLPEVTDAQPDPECPDIYTPPVKKFKSNVSFYKFGS